MLSKCFLSYASKWKLPEVNGNDNQIEYIILKYTMGFKAKDKIWLLLFCHGEKHNICAETIHPKKVEQCLT